MKLQQQKQIQKYSNKNFNIIIMSMSIPIQTYVLKKIIYLKLIFYLKNFFADAIPRLPTMRQRQFHYLTCSDRPKIIPKRCFTNCTFNYEMDVYEALMVHI